MVNWKFCPFSVTVVVVHFSRTTRPPNLTQKILPGLFKWMKWHASFQGTYIGYLRRNTIALFYKYFLLKQNSHPYIFNFLNFLIYIMLTVILVKPWPQGSNLGPHIGFKFIIATHGKGVRNYQDNTLFTVYIHVW